MEDNEKQLSFELKDAEKGYVVLSIIGDLTMWSLPAAKEEIQKLYDAHKVKVVLDLERTSYIDSSGLGFFIGTLKKLKSADGDLLLINLNTYILGIFQMLHLQEIIDLYQDLTEASKYFKD